MLLSSLGTKSSSLLSRIDLAETKTTRKGLGSIKNSLRRSLEKRCITILSQLCREKEPPFHLFLILLLRAVIHRAERNGRYCHNGFSYLLLLAMLKRETGVQYNTKAIGCGEMDIKRHRFQVAGCTVYGAWTNRLGEGSSGVPAAALAAMGALVAAQGYRSPASSHLWHSSSPRLRLIIP